jgi:hypothetical protein
MPDGRRMAENLNAGIGLVSRRSFLVTAGMATAASAFGPALTGCGSGLSLFIPCLGPASAPTQIPGMTYVWASKIGCALNCNLEDGSNKYKSGPATDDAPRINAAMEAATADHPITLIIDGSALISGLFLPAGGHWSIAGLGCGTGFFVMTGANNDGIHNGPSDAATPFNPGPPAPPRGSSVSLSNFTLNGNQGDGHKGDSTSGLRQGANLGYWYCGINLMNLDNITVEKVVVVNVPSFHFRFSNVGNVSVSGSYMISEGLSTDGLHFDGPANDITITNCTFATGDDSIALNCPEGYSGNISRVAVSDCSFNSLSLMRLYTTYGGGTNFYIDTVSVSNCTGSLSEAAFLIGTNNGSNPDSIRSLTISDCRLTTSTILAIAENFGTIELTNVTFVPSMSGVVWVQPQANTTCAFVRPSPLYGVITSVGSNLLFNNCTIFRTSGMDVDVVMLENDSTIANLEFNGFAVQDAGSYSSVPELLNIGSKSVGQLVIDSLNGGNLKAPSPNLQLTKVDLVSGAGVLATGWEFPDALMADEVPYISATTGLPSIKIGGVVEPYP